MKIAVRPLTRLVVFAFVLAVFALAAAASASAQIVTNGGFETGDLTGWTTFTTSNGTIGTPTVTQFDTTGTGTSYAAQFNVGEVNPDATEQGGGIYQTVNVPTAGTYAVAADVASDTPLGNADCGTFSLLIDGTTEASNAFGQCMTSGSVVRNHLSGTMTLSAGSHELRVLITRPYTTINGETPNEYVDNVSLVLALAVACTPGSVAVGGTTSCTATAAGASVTPTGPVSFSVPSGDGSFTPASCTLVPTTGTSAACTVSYGPSQVGGGTHTITASYGGDTNNPAVTATTTVAVTKATSQTAQTCAPSSLTLGASTTCTATVSGAGARPAGTVTFSAGGKTLGTCTLPVSGADACSISFKPSASGTTTISASYGGDANHLASSSSAHLTVAPAPATAVCKVPRLVHKTLAQAKRLLSHQHCTLGKVTRASSVTTRTGRLEVTKQAVKAGSVRKVNAKIALVLGRTGPAPTPRFTG